MAYTAIIVDDEVKLSEVIDIKLTKHCPEIKVVGKAANAADAFELIMKEKPNIVFLDIAMPGESGFDLLHKFDTINFQVIFATGYNEYALDALKLSAVDYILKPINTEDLKNAVSKAIENINTQEKIEKYEVLKHNIKNVGKQEAKIALSGKDGFELVKVADIIRCEGWQKYSKIHLTNGRTIISSYNIGVYKNMLEPYDFCSCHKSHLINEHLMKKYLNEGFVVMIDDSKVPVARRKKEKFFEKILALKNKNPD